MLGLSQAGLSQEILLLGFLYVHSSFPWTAPSCSGALAPACLEEPALLLPGCCNRTPCHWRQQSPSCPCPALNKASSSLSRGLGLHFSLSLSPAHSSHSSCDKLSLDSQLTTLPLMRGRASLAAPSSETQPSLKAPIKPFLSAAVATSFTFHGCWGSLGCPELFPDPSDQSCTTQTQEANTAAPMSSDSTHTALPSFFPPAADPGAAVALPLCVLVWDLCAQGLFWTPTRG